jgi:hypothetical protein
MGPPTTKLGERWTEPGHHNTELKTQRHMIEHHYTQTSIRIQ